MQIKTALVFNSLQTKCCCQFLSIAWVFVWDGKWCIKRKCGNGCLPPSTFHCWDSVSKVLKVHRPKSLVVWGWICVGYGRGEPFTVCTQICISLGKCVAFWSSTKSQWGKMHLRLSCNWIKKKIRTSIVKFSVWSDWSQNAQNYVPSGPSLIGAVRFSNNLHIVV